MRFDIFELNGVKHTLAVELNNLNFKRCELGMRPIKVIAVLKYEENETHEDSEDYMWWEAKVLAVIPFDE